MIELLQKLTGPELLGLTAILCLALILAPTLMLYQWRKAGEANRNTTLKRELLAKGMSVDDIDRLTAPASVRQAQVDADISIRKAQIAADLKRDLLARGLSVADIKGLTSERDAHLGLGEEASALANAIVEMAPAGALNQSAVERLLTVFLEKDARRGERLGQPGAAKQPVQAAQQEPGPGGGSRDGQGVFVEPIAAADRPRD
jgi:hypothetical protein